jgi:hypothetical protein
MKGVTKKIVHPEYRTIIVLDSGQTLATRHDGGPHFVVPKDQDATKLFGESKPWETGRTRHSDDNWQGAVDFAGDALAIAEARSKQLYNDDGTLRSASASPSAP